MVSDPLLFFQLFHSNPMELFAEELAKQVGTITAVARDEGVRFGEQFFFQHDLDRTHGLSLTQSLGCFGRLGDLVFANGVGGGFGAHAGGGGGEDFAIDHFLGAAGFHVDGVGHGDQHVHVGRAAAVAGEFEAVGVGRGGDFHPLCDAAGAAVVGLDDVGAALVDEVGELVFGVEIFAGGDADVEFVGEFAVAVHVVGHEGLFVPEAAHVLIDAAAAEGFVAVEDLVGVDHDSLAFADGVEGEADAFDVVVEIVAADLDFDRLVAVFHGGDAAALEDAVVRVIIGVPAGHGVDGHAVAIGAEHAPDGLIGGFAEDIPDGDIGGGEGEVDHAAYAVIFEQAPEFGADLLGEGRVHAGDDGFDFVFEDCLNDAGAAGDHAEIGAGPAGDAGVGFDAENDLTAIDAELVDGVISGLFGGEFKQVRLDAGDADLLLQIGAPGGGGAERGGEPLTAVHATNDISTAGEGGEFHHVVGGDVFKREAGLSPRVESTADDAGVEAFFSENVRHTGAGGVVRSSAVEIDFFGFGEGGDGVGQAVGFEALGALDALGSGVIVAVGADVEDGAVDIGGFDTGNGAVDAGLPGEPEAVGDPGEEGEEEEGFDDSAGAAHGVEERGQEVAEGEADADVDADVEDDAGEIEEQELGEGHAHGAGEWRSHGVQAGDEFREEEDRAAAAVESFGGGEDAGVRIGGDAAEDAEEPPAGVAAEEEVEHVADEEGGDAGEEGVEEGEFAKGDEGAGCEQGDGGGHRKAEGFDQTDGKQEPCAVACE